MKLLSRPQLRELGKAIEDAFAYGEMRRINSGDPAADAARVEALRNSRLATLKLIREQQKWIRNTLQITEAWEL